MRKLLLLTALILTLSVNGWAQRSILLKIGGVHTNSFKKVGLDAGLEMGYNFDEMVNLNIGGAIQKTGEKETEKTEKILSGGVSSDSLVVLSEDNHYVFPLKAGIRIRLPLGAAVLPVISGDIGYALYNRKVSGVDDVELQAEGLHTGLFWDAGIGFDWKLGSRSSLVGDILYQSSNPKNKNGYERSLQGVRFQLGLLMEY